MDSNLTEEEIRDFQDRADKARMNKTVPFGIYEGKKIKDVPEDYLVWYTRNFAANGFNNDLKWYANRVIKRQEEERKKATAIQVNFDDPRYTYGKQKTKFYMTQKVLETALNGAYQLDELNAYSISYEIPTHLLQVDGCDIPFRAKLFIQVSFKGWTLMLVNHQKREMYLSKLQRFEP